MAETAIKVGDTVIECGQVIAMTVRKVDEARVRAFCTWRTLNGLTVGSWVPLCRLAPDGSLPPIKLPTTL